MGCTEFHSDIQEFSLQSCTESTLRVQTELRGSKGRAKKAAASKPGQKSLVRNSNEKDCTKYNDCNNKTNNENNNTENDDNYDHNTIIMRMMIIIIKTVIIVIIRIIITM